MVPATFCAPSRPIGATVALGCARDRAGDVGALERVAIIAPLHIGFL